MAVEEAQPQHHRDQPGAEPGQEFEDRDDRKAIAACRSVEPTAARRSRRPPRGGRRRPGRRPAASAGPGSLEEVAPTSEESRRHWRLVPVRRLRPKPMTAAGTRATRATRIRTETQSTAPTQTRAPPGEHGSDQLGHVAAEVCVESAGAPVGRQRELAGPFAPSPGRSEPEDVAEQPASGGGRHRVGRPASRPFGASPPAAGGHGDPDPDQLSFDLAERAPAPFEHPPDHGGHQDRLDHDRHGLKEAPETESSSSDRVSGPARRCAVDRTAVRRAIQPGEVTCETLPTPSRRPGWGRYHASKAHGPATEPAGRPGTCDLGLGHELGGDLGQLGGAVGVDPVAAS